MRSLIVGFVLAIWFGLPPALAADVSLLQSTPTVRQLPFPRSERADAVWNERACWSECGARTTWRMAACLEHDTQGNCLRLANTADRYCQRECRTMGGPYVPDIFDALN